MALTLTNQAPLINRVKNDILFFVNTNNVYSASGVKAALQISYNSASLNNETMVIGRTNLSDFTFTFKTTPNESGTELPIQGADTTAVYVANVVTYLKKNYELNNQYNVYAALVFGNWVINFVARDKGVLYNFLSFTCTRFDVVSVVAGVDQVKRSNYNIVFQVWVLDGTDYVMSGEEWISPDKDGNVRFNASGYISPYIIPGFTWDIGIAGTTYKWTNNFRKFFIRYGEAYGDIPVVYGLTESSEMYALPGKIDEHLFGEKYRLNESSWSTYRLTFNVAEEFLTNMPTEKTISKYAHERLFLPYIPTGVTPGFRVNYRIYYDDGTTYDHFFAESYSDLCIIEVIPQIYYNLLEQHQPGKEIIKYDVWVTNQLADIISPTQTYIIETSRYMQEHQFIFQNPKGGFDYARLFGVQEVSGTTESTEVLEGPKMENPFARRKYTTVNFIGKDQVSVNTGYLDKKGLDWLYELQETEFEGAWEIIPRDASTHSVYDDDIYPISLLPGEIPKHRDDKFIREIVFSYTRDKIKLEKPTKILVYGDDMDSAFGWLKKLEDQVTNSPDLTYVNTPPDTGYQFTSATTLVAFLKWPTGLFSSFCMSGEKFEVVIDVDVPGSEDIEITPFVTDIEGATETLNGSRRIIRQQFIAQPTVGSDFMIKIKNPDGVLDARIAFIHSFNLYRCLE